MFRTIVVKSIIDLTDAAAKEIKKISHITNKNILLSAKGGGCGGLKYDISPVKKIDKKLNKIQKSGATLYIDNRSEMHLIGTTIDYEKTDFEEGFRFIPNKKVITCGCGRSFSFKECSWDDPNSTITGVIKKPEPPSDEECCGDGCVNCVWVEYFKKLMEYQNRNDKV